VYLALESQAGFQRIPRRFQVKLQGIPKEFQPRFQGSLRLSSLPINLPRKLEKTPLSRNWIQKKPLIESLEFPLCVGLCVFQEISPRIASMAVCFSRKNLGIILLAYFSQD